VVQAGGLSTAESSSPRADPSKEDAGVPRQQDGMATDDGLSGSDGCRRLPNESQQAEEDDDQQRDLLLPGPCSPGSGSQGEEKQQEEEHQEGRSMIATRPLPLFRSQH
jgi:hypothetical protein